MSRSRFGVTFERNLSVPMRDGTLLYCDVYLPSGGGRYPVLLQRTPYNKALPAVTHIGNDPIRFAGAGYAVVIQDTRGRHASEGDFYAFQYEVLDGYDTVEWCAAQPWSTGRVGMFGASYVGLTQWLAAISQPPHLVTIAPGLTASDCHDGWIYRSGAFELGFSLSWVLTTLARDTATRSPEEQHLIPQLIAELDDLPSAFRCLPLRNQPAVTEAASYYADWLEHPEEDDYWRRWKIEDFHSQLSLPVFNIGGWYDTFVGGTVQNFVGLRERAASAEARASQRLLVGPWSHGNPWLANPVGQADFGVFSESTACDLEGLQLRWFDHWLKDEDNGVPDDPPARIFVMGTNVWRDEQEWPLARTAFREYYFHSDGRANSSSGDGVLNDQPSDDEPPESAVRRVPSRCAGVYV
jgi:putative CocE/NonD family hydrolase